MTQRHPLIPVEIYIKVDPEVRQFFNDLLKKLTQQQNQVKLTGRKQATRKLVLSEQCDSVTTTQSTN